MQLELVPRIECPILCIRGDQESADRYPAEEFQRAAKAPCSVVIIPDCDHFYNENEDEVIRALTSWLTRTLTLPNTSR